MNAMERTLALQKRKQLKESAVRLGHEVSRALNFLGAAGEISKPEDAAGNRIADRMQLPGFLGAPFTVCDPNKDSDPFFNPGIPGTGPTRIEFQVDEDGLYGLFVDGTPVVGVMADPESPARIIRQHAFHCIAQRSMAPAIELDNLPPGKHLFEVRKVDVGTKSLEELNSTFQSILTCDDCKKRAPADQMYGGGYIHNMWTRCKDCCDRRDRDKVE